MQDIYFDKVVLKNVRCHEHMEMEFPTGKFIAIIGKNGRGKSTIPKALSMALYGTDDEGTRISDMVNKKTKKNLEILLFFRIIDGDKEDSYEIRLYQKHQQFQDKMFLLRNGVDISGKTKTDTYKLIENIYIPKNVHYNTIHFAQQVKDFFTALANADQKEIFNAILSLEEWLIRYNKTEKVLSQVQNSILDQKEVIIQRETAIPEREKFLEKLYQDKADKEIEVSEQIVKLKSDICDQENRIKTLKQEQDKLGFKQEDLDEIKKAIMTLESEQNFLELELKNLIAVFEEKQQQKLQELDTQFSSVLIKGKNEVETFFNRQKNDENSKLKLVLERKSQVSERFSYDDLEDDRKSFENDKRNEQKVLDSDISKCDLKFSQSLEETRNRKDSKLKSLNEKKVDIEKNSERIKAEAEAIKKEVSRLTEEVSKDEKELSQEISRCIKCGQELDKKLKEKLAVSVAENKILIQSAQEKLLELKEKFLTLKTNYDELSRLIITEETNFENEIDALKKKQSEEIEVFQTKKSLIDKEIREHSSIIDAKIDDRKCEESKELRELEEDQAAIETVVKKLDENLSDAIHTIEEKNQKDLLQSKKEQIENLNSEHEKQIAQIENRQKDSDVRIGKETEKLRKLEELKHAQDEYSEKISYGRQIIEISSNQLSDLEHFEFDVSFIEQTKNEINSLKAELEKIKAGSLDLFRKVDILTFWKEGFSDRGIKSMLIDSSIPFMNRICMEELEKTTAGKFVVSFDTLSETKSGEIRDRIAVHVLNCETGADSHKLLSGGEKRLVDLCCMRALQKLQENQYQKRIHNTFFDEALDALDEDNAAIFCRLMKQMSDDKNVTIITHKIFQTMEADQVYKL